MEKNDPGPQRNQEFECTINQSDPNGERARCVPFLSLNFITIEKFNLIPLTFWVSLHIYVNLN